LKILFLTANIPNYVVDGLFHGLRSISGVAVVDIPRLDYMYVNASKDDLVKTGSKGNTLYKLLPDAVEVQGKRTFWQRDIEEYDFIIFTDIYQQADLFHNVYNSIHPKKRDALCIVDGYDVTSAFPFFNNHYNLKVRPWSYFYGVRKVSYFKREYENAGALFGLSNEKFGGINKILSKLIKRPSAFFPISMSVPEEHIEYIPLKDKLQDFVNYNVDDDLAELFPARSVAELGKWQPAFEKQDEYFSDIRNSKFGITSKRAGWDCLRHYEYAAKGAILCFKDIAAKSSWCAPFELNDTNCIAYSTKQDLLNKLNTKSALELESIQENQYRWIERFTTRQVAMRFLEKLQSVKKVSKTFVVSE
jgi:hypothetical protein